MRIRRGRIALATVILLLAGPGTALASSVTACGPTICYQYDNAQPAMAVFGTPTLLGDALRFLPASQLATGARSGSSITTATFVVDRAYSPDGTDLASITVQELGDYLLRGRGQVSADLYLLVTSNSAPEFALDTDSFGFPETYPGSSRFMSRLTAEGSSGHGHNWHRRWGGEWDRDDGEGRGRGDGHGDHDGHGHDYGHGDDHGEGGGGLGLWTLNAGIDAAGLFTGTASDVAISIQDTLTASGKGNFIQKKAGFLISATVVPAPAVGWMLMPGIAALLRLGKGGRR